MEHERPAGLKLRERDTERRMPEIRKLGHVVLKVRDLAASEAFYCDVLGFKVSDRNEKGMVFLRHGSDHHSLALAHVTSDRPLAGPDEVGLHHFAWEVQDLDDVIQAREHLRREGVRIVFEGRRGAGSNVGVEVQDPDGNVVEIYCDMDQIGWDGTSRPSDQWRRTGSLDEL